MPATCFAFNCSHRCAIDRLKRQDKIPGRIKKKRAVLVDRPKCELRRFPKDPALFKKWEKFCSRKDSRANSNSRLCSCHFASGEYKMPKFHAWKADVSLNFQDPPDRVRVRRSVREEQGKEPEEVPEALARRKLYSAIVERNILIFLLCSFHIKNAS